jgi:hypothetical protein
MTIRWLLRPLSDSIESESGLAAHVWSHLLRKTAIHLSGKCSRRCMLSASILCAALFASDAPAQDVGASADMIAAWNTRANAIAREKRDPPLSRARSLAILHVAMFEAMNAIEGPDKLHTVNLSADGHASVEAAAASAAHAVLVALNPEQTADLSSALAASLAGIANGVPKVRGYAAGKNAAAAVLARWLSTATGKKDMARQIGGPTVDIGP